MYIIRSITIKTSFLLHKILPGLILGGYIHVYRYTPRRYGPEHYCPELAVLMMYAYVERGGEGKKGK